LSWLLIRTTSLYGGCLSAWSRYTPNSSIYKGVVGVGPTAPAFAPIHGPAASRRTDGPLSFSCPAVPIAFLAGVLPTAIRVPPHESLRQPAHGRFSGNKKSKHGRCGCRST
jgi:hypothetical protein